MPACSERKVIDIRRSDVNTLLVDVAKERARPHKEKRNRKTIEGPSTTTAYAGPGKSSRLRHPEMFNLSIR